MQDRGIEFACKSKICMMQEKKANRRSHHSFMLVESPAIFDELYVLDAYLSDGKCNSAKHKIGLCVGSSN